MKIKTECKEFKDYRTEIQWAKEGYVVISGNKGVKLRANAYHTKTAVYFSPEEVKFVGKSSNAAKDVLDARKRANKEKQAFWKRVEEEEKEEREECARSILERNSKPLFLEDKDVPLYGKKTKGYEGSVFCELTEREERLLYVLYGEETNRIPVSRAIYETMSFDEIEELEYYSGDDSVDFINDNKLARCPYSSSLFVLEQAGSGGILD